MAIKLLLIYQPKLSIKKRSLFMLKLNEFYGKSEKDIVI